MDPYGSSLNHPRNGCKIQDAQPLGATDCKGRDTPINLGGKFPADDFSMVPWQAEKAEKAEKPVEKAELRPDGWLQLPGLAAGSRNPAAHVFWGGD